MKKIYNNGIKAILFLGLLLNTGCKTFLEEKIFSQYDPNQFLQDKTGVDALLTGAYSALAVTGYGMRDNYHILGEFCTDMALESGGGLERTVIPIMQFNWDADGQYFSSQYNIFYSAISRANNVLLVTQSLSGVDAATIAQINGEAKFIKGFSYFMLHNLFGPTPIIEIPAGSSLEAIEKIGKETARPTEEQYQAYVEENLMFAAKNLKAGAVSSRANLGSAWAILTKFYLNNRQWQKAADAANEVLKLDYALYADYPKLFAVDGENNKEFIYRFECLAAVGSPQVNVYMPHAFPPAYRIQSNWTNFGAQFRTYTAFYEKYDLTDIRRQLFIDEHLEIGKTVITKLNRDAAGKALDNARSFKFLPDPLAIGDNHGNDIPYVRLADIILSRAEALNEIAGPTQEAIDLINRVRARAKVTLLKLSDNPTKEKLRDFILEERAKEFVSEGKRREDLIRQNKFIQQALDRKVAAKPFHILYPLPRAQLDNNPNLRQNDGY